MAKPVQTMNKGVKTLMFQVVGSDLMINHVKIKEGDIIDIPEDKLQKYDNIKQYLKLIQET
jgi:hypothetical protein